MSKSFAEAVNEKLEANSARIAKEMQSKPLAGANSVVDVVFDVFKNGFKSVDKEEALKVFDNVYDQYISKIDLPGAFDALAHSLLKSLGRSLLGNAIDRLKTA